MSEFRPAGDTRKLQWAFAEIVILWLAIVATMTAFFLRSPTASRLLVPYLAWVSFVSVLHFAIWRLNTPEMTHPANWKSCERFVKTDTRKQVIMGESQRS